MKMSVMHQTRSFDSRLLGLNTPGAYLSDIQRFWCGSGVSSDIRHATPLPSAAAFKEKVQDVALYEEPQVPSCAMGSSFDSINKSTMRSSSERANGHIVIT